MMSKGFIIRLIPWILLDDICLIFKDLSLTLVAKVKEFSSLETLREICDNESFNNMIVSYLGGFSVFLEFSSSDAKDKFKKHWGVSYWFFVIFPRMKTFVIDERVFWVDVDGIPPVSCSSNMFTKIESKWGNLMYVKDPDDNNLCRKRLCIKTTLDCLIMESFKVAICGKIFVARPREIMRWNPEYIVNSYDLDSNKEDIYFHASNLKRDGLLFYEKEDMETINGESKFDWIVHDNVIGKVTGKFQGCI